jgi:hypothetical protein
MKYDHIAANAFTYPEWWTTAANASPASHRSLTTTNQTSSLVDFSAIVRAQIAEIIESDAAVPNWKAGLPTVANNNPPHFPAGASVTLTKVRDHIDDDSDPHGATLTQTNIACTGNLATSGTTDLGNGTGDELTIKTGTSQTIFNCDNATSTTGGIQVTNTGHPLIRLAGTAQNASDGFLCERFIHWSSAALDRPDGSAETATTGRYIRDDDGGSTYTRCIFDLTNVFAGAANANMGWYLNSLIVCAESHVDPVVATTTGQGNDYAITATLWRSNTNTAPFEWVQLNIGNHLANSVGSPVDPLGAGWFADDIGTTGQVSANLITSLNSPDGTPSTEADRTIKWGEGLVLTVTLWHRTGPLTTDESPHLIGVRVGGEQYYLHP